MQANLNSAQQLIDHLSALSFDITAVYDPDLDKDINHIRMSFKEKGIDLLQSEEWDLSILKDEHVKIKELKIQIGGYRLVKPDDVKDIYYVLFSVWTPVCLMRNLVQISKFIDFHINGDVEFIVNVNDRILKIFNGISLYSFVGKCFLFRSKMNEKTIAVAKVEVDISKVERYREMRILMLNNNIPNLKIEESNTFFIANENYFLL